MQRIIKDVADADLAFWQSALELDGFTVEQQTQDGGLKSLIGTKPGDETFASDGTGLAWGQKVSPAFRQKLRDCCARLRVNPDFLMAAMAFETGETFSPSTNERPIQGYRPDPVHAVHGSKPGNQYRTVGADDGRRTARFRGEAFPPLHWSSAVVGRHLYGDLVSRGHRSEQHFVLFRRGTIAYDQNRGLDANGDGLVTKDEAAQRVRSKLNKGREPQFIA